MISPRYCAFPTSLELDEVRTEFLGAVVASLVARQNADGSWGSGSALDRLISTSHVTMTLTVAGIDPHSEVLQGAADWLSAQTTQQHNNSYWALAPLAGLPIADPAAIERAVLLLENVLRMHAKPHPQQLVEAYYLRALVATGVTGDPAVRAASLDFIRENYGGEGGWFDRVDSTTDGYSALHEFDRPMAARIRADVIRFIRTHTTREGDTAHWSSVVSTAYTVMNLVSCDLADDPQIRSLVSGAERWLRGMQQSDGTWRIESPPYGGVGDIVSVEYPTAVVARALLSVWASEEPEFRLALAHFRANGLRRQAADISKAAAQEVASARNSARLGWGFAILAALFPVREYILGTLEALNETTDWVQTLDVAGIIVGIVVGIVTLLLHLNHEYWSMRIRRLAFWRRKSHL